MNLLINQRPNHPTSISGTADTGCPGKELEIAGK